MKFPKKLNNLKLAFITGATKGIGRSTAITFAKAGWDLILLSRNMELMEKLKSELLTTKSKINLVKCDLSNPLEIEHCVKEAIEKYGCPSVLINNAGCAFNSPLVEMELGQWEQTIQINLTSVFQICSSIVPQMRKNGGLVINVSSHASYNSFTQWGAYCVSKAALASFTKCCSWNNSYSSFMHSFFAKLRSIHASTFYIRKSIKSSSRQTTLNSW